MKKLRKKTSLQSNEPTYTFTKSQLDELIYNVQREAKVAAVRQIVRHMIRIGALIITDNISDIYRPKKTRLEVWLGYCSKYVSEFKSLVPEGKLKEVDEKLTKACPCWEEKL